MHIYDSKILNSNILRLFENSMLTMLFPKLKICPFFSVTGGCLEDGVHVCVTVRVTYIDLMIDGKEVKVQHVVAYSGLFPKGLCVGNVIPKYGDLGRC